MTDRRNAQAPSLIPRVRKVISASRRTDLLAHYPEYFAARLRALGPGKIHTVVVWTKDASNLLRHRELREALAGVGQVFVHWTITGLGGSFLEPRAPEPADQLRLLPDVVAYLGDPLRLHWRYDPLIAARCGDERLSNIDLGLFSSLAQSIAAAGVPAVHTSFVTLYPKVVRRLAAAGVEVELPAADERHAFLLRLSQAASRVGMQLVTCCEEAFGRQRCIDGSLLASLHPTREATDAERARGQRELCGCTKSLDIGRYLPCPNRCLYCYAHPVSRATGEGREASEVVL